MKKIKQILGLVTFLFYVTVGWGIPVNKSELRSKPTHLLTADPINEGDKHTVKIALLLDTSNSMDGLIHQAKAQLWDIVNQFTYAKCGTHNHLKRTVPKLEIALYEYGNDNLSSKEGYIRQVIGFSSDLDEISEKLFSLTTNGGEEFCGAVIATSLNQLEWGKNPDNLKMIFIAGNEPFTQGKLNYKDAVTNAKEKNIVVNTIFCGNYDQGISSHWKDGAVLSGGEYISIDHNRQVVHIYTPYDDIIIQLNSKLNKTYISYGQSGRRKLELQRTQDSNAQELEEAVIVKRAVSKSSKLYNNATWDLVDAADDKEFDLDAIKKEELPKDLQNKSKEALKKYIDTKKTERSNIQKEIQELNRKREAYIQKHQKEDSKGELENAMLRAIKKQAALKNYTWE